MQNLIFFSHFNCSGHKNHLSNLNKFSGSKVNTLLFNVTWKFLLLLRKFTKLDTFPILIDACFWKILGTFYPIWIILDPFQQPQWGFHIYSIKTNFSNVLTRYEQETTPTFFLNTLYLVLPSSVPVPVPVKSNLNWDLHYNHSETTQPPSHPPGQVYLSHF